MSSLQVQFWLMRSRIGLEMRAFPSRYAEIALVFMRSSYQVSVVSSNLRDLGYILRNRFSENLLHKFSLA
ncbi:hypothetical protein CEXT_555011 [Caerostris extrusa]|uniref:Uncharacterized protein n=1 Tax=Caerostris extrusa TaxID=172846 RepID=A0AAV4N7J1_CAEEX|nr:hypothetical protein CEXT_555011 [Caerostris extrusa]